jgi:hypothetical protein
MQVYAAAVSVFLTAEKAVSCSLRSPKSNFEIRLPHALTDSHIHFSSCTVRLTLQLQFNERWPGV